MISTASSGEFISLFFQRLGEQERNIIDTPNEETPIQEETVSPEPLSNVDLLSEQFDHASLDSAKGT